MKTKKCSNKNCNKKFKPLSAFTKDKTRKDKLSVYCKDCVKEIAIQNKKSISVYQKHYRDKNKEKSQKYYKKYRMINKEKIQHRDKKYYRRNLNKILEYAKKYRLNNTEKINKYFVKRRKTDIGFKLEHNLRTRLNIALRGVDKSLSTMFLIGCETDYLMYHVQCQFRNGMNWDNYGKWHIDHIKPCASFDLADPDQQKECFHYTNLQPLWAKDNLKKSNKY